MWTCKCGNLNLDKKTVCAVCGREKRVSLWTCKCGESNPLSARNCQSCGASINEFKRDLERSNADKTDIEHKRIEEERRRLEEAVRFDREQEDYLRRVAEQEKARAEAQRRREEEQAKARSETLQNQFKAKLENLKSKGYDGYYQYRVLSLCDDGGFFNSNAGRVNTAYMMQVLNSLGLEGWHLVTAYTNELGKNSIAGLNSTIDENILIFERFVKIEE